MTAVSVGLIGCGRMGRALADSLRKIEEARLVAVADPVEEARRRAAQAYGAQAYPACADLLAQPHLDAVIVATPNYLHKEVTLAAAAAGKHVFCEKPMALSVADCDAMIQATESAGVKLMVGHVLRLMFPFWRIAELAREGELGAPVCVHIRRLQRPLTTGWRRRRELSGGPLFEVNVHELDLMRHLCGEVEQVSAYGGRFIAQEVDYHDIYLVNLRFRSGAVGHLHAGCVGPSEYHGLVICPRGTLWFGPGWGTGTVQRKGGEPEPLRAEGRDGPVGLDWELSSFVSWVLRDEPPVVTARDARAAIELAEATCRSIEEGRPISLPL